MRILGFNDQTIKPVDFASSLRFEFFGKDKEIFVSFIFDNEVIQPKFCDKRYYCTLNEVLLGFEYLLMAQRSVLRRKEVCE